MCRLRKSLAALICCNTCTGTMRFTEIRRHTDGRTGGLIVQGRHASVCLCACVTTRDNEIIPSISDVLVVRAWPERRRSGSFFVGSQLDAEPWSVVTHCWRICL